MTAIPTGGMRRASSQVFWVNIVGNVLLCGHDLLYSVKSVVKFTSDVLADGCRRIS